MISRRRVVITGSSAITSLGPTLDMTFDAIMNGWVNVCPSTHFPDIPVHPVEHFQLKDYIGSCKNRRYLSRGAMFAVAAAASAISDAGLSPPSLLRAGLFVGAGPHFDLEDDLFTTGTQSVDWERVPALWMLKFLPNTACSVISQLFGVHGESMTLQTACTASLNAIGEAFRKIRDGYLDIAIAGGGDSRLNRFALMAYEKAGALAHSSDGPQTAGRPFDRNRGGFVPGEGGAFFILEDYDHAVRRNATILGEVLGFGASIDGYAMTAPHPDGEHAQAAMLNAMSDAGIPEDRIDLISSHGTGTLLNDEMEARLIHSTFTRKPPLVIALKSWIGHLSAACGAAEAVISLKIMHSGMVPPVRNLELPIHDSVQLVKKKIARKVKTILIENFGFGGHNSVLILSR